MPRKTIYILLWIFSLGLCVNAGRTIWELWKRKDVVNVRQEELSRIKQENRTLEVTLKDIQSETYLERIARDKLGMVKEGEIIIIMPEAGNSLPAGEAGGQGSPNWKKWWGLFF